LFQAAKYTGIFHSYRSRWWRNRLFRIAQGVIFKHKLRGTLFEQFSQAFELETRQQLTPALCVYDGTPVADWVCSVLAQPVKQRNSLPYYPDSRPAVMDQARVSFKAIKESCDFDENLVDAEGYQMIAELWG